LQALGRAPHPRLAGDPDGATPATPTQEDLLVLYLNGEADPGAVSRLVDSGGDRNRAAQRRPAPVQSCRPGSAVQRPLLGQMTVTAGCRRSPGRQRAGSLANMTARQRRRGAYPGRMGRIILTLLGAILAIGLVFTAIGWIFAMLKTFLIIGLIAVVVFIVVSLLAKRRRRD
jgi:predicted lipid-binding transport protein (Tim44 family)